MKTHPRHLIELDYMNAIGCLAVIAIHVLSYSVTYSDSSTLAAMLMFLPWKLASFAVPMFVFTGAVKLSLQVQQKPVTLHSYGRYLWSRAGKIYLPYLLWVVVYQLVFVAIGYTTSTIDQLGQHLLWGTISSHFYYIVFLMQFYLLLPLWQWMLKHISPFVAVCTSLVLMQMMWSLSNFLNLWGMSFAYSDRIFLSYGLYWVIGLYVGQYYQQVVDYLKEGTRGLVPSLGIIAVYLFFGYLQYGKQLWLFDMTLVKMVFDITCIMLLLRLFLWLQDTGLNRVKALLSGIAQASFGVYLSHCLFLTVVTYYLQINGITRISTILVVRGLVCYSVPFLLYYGWQCIKGKVCR